MSAKNRIKAASASNPENNNCFQFRQIVEVQNLLPIQVKRVFTHHEPSIDDAVAFCNLKFHSEHLFPGISDAEYAVCGREEMESMLEPYGGDTIRFLIEAKTLIVGMSGSFLDEHEDPRNNHFRPEGECAASLTARLTGMDTNPNWMNIVSYALADDTGRREDYRYLNADLTLPNLLKAAYESHPDNLGWAFDAAINLIELRYQALDAGLINPNERPDWTIDSLASLTDHEWAQKARQNFYAAHDVIQKREEAMNIPLRNMTSFHPYTDWQCEGTHIALACSDFANSHDIIFQNSEASIVVMRRSDDRVQIFTRTSLKIDLTNVIGILRQLENKAMGLPYNEPGVNYFQAGKINESKKWVLFKSDNGSSMIFNGSRTSPDTEPTVLTNEHILQALKVGLKQRPRVTVPAELAPKPSPAKRAKKVTATSKLLLPQAHQNTDQNQPQVTAYM